MLWRSLEESVCEESCSPEDTPTGEVSFVASISIKDDREKRLVVKNEDGGELTDDAVRLR